MVNNIKVIKRDGREVDFDAEKIYLAVKKAFESVGQIMPAKIFKDIEYMISRISTNTSVETIQDNVERILMDSKYFKAAKAYIIYRDKHATLRETKTRQLFESIINTEKNDVTRDNANMNADTPAGMMMKFSAETTKPFVDKYVLSPEVKEAVDNNYIHIHDKDYYLTKSFTCLQHPLDRIFESGFRIGHGEARAPKRIETAAMLAVISLESIQNEMHRIYCAAI